MTKYWKEFTIPYYDTDGEGYIRPENILCYMAETSSWHSDSLGVGFDVLIGNDHAWMLNRWEVEIVKYPRSKDKVQVKTWTSSFDRFYATREFVMEDSQGQTLAKASTKWFFLDIGKRRPKRIPQDLQEKYNFIEEYNFRDFSQMEDEPGNLQSSDLMKVRKSDIDSNNHVNNIRYIEWMQEGLPEHLTRDRRISGLGIVYRKEILPGDEFVSRWWEDKVQTGRIHHEISVPGEKNAQGFTLWKEKGLLE